MARSRRREQLPNRLFHLRPHRAGGHHFVGGIQKKGFAGPGVHVVLRGQAALIGHLRPLGATVVERHIDSIRAGIHADANRLQPIFVKLGIKRPLSHEVGL